jgi:hypothetical protein
MALKHAFPILFGITCANDAFVATRVEFFGGGIQWNMNFVSAAHDWELDAFASFFKMLYLVRMRREGEGRQDVVGPFQKRVVWC